MSSLENFYPSKINLSIPNSSAHINNQIGGNHYKQFKIQPVEFIYKNNIGFMEGNAIKYLCRYKSKGGIEDLRKAKHYIEMLIELETAEPTTIEKLNKAKENFYKEEDEDET